MLHIMLLWIFTYEKSSDEGYKLPLISMHSETQLDSETEEEYKIVET
jgi:hypothetical protein